MTRHKSATSLWLVFCAALAMTAPSAVASGSAPSARFTNYVERSTGLMFHYPADAKVSENPEPDVIVRVAGATDRHVPYSFDLRSTDAPAATDAQAMMNMLVRKLVPQLDHATVLSQDRFVCGKSRQITASSAVLAVRYADKPYRQKLVLFADPSENNRLRMMAFSAPEADYNAVEPLFNDILLSLTHESGTAAAAHATTAGGATGAETYRADRVSFGYPSGWSLVEAPDKDTIARFRCPGTTHNAEMALASSVAPIGYSNAQIAKMLEDEHWSKLSGFRLLEQKEQLCGKRRNVDGARHMATFYLDNTNANAQLFVFKNGQKFYCLTYTTFGIKPEDAARQFDQVLATIACD